MKKLKQLLMALLEGIQNLKAYKAEKYKNVK